MLYYIIPFLIWLTICIRKALNGPQKFRFLDYIFALPLILLVVLRGEVGTDTVNYVASVQDVMWWGSQSQTGDEFSYILLMRFLAMFTSDPRIVVAAVSLLAAILFFAALYMWEDGQCIMSLVFVPLCFFSFTMNTLRIGIAFPLAAMSILQLEKKRFALFYILALVSISFQMTAVLLLPMLLLARRGAKMSLKGTLYGLLLAAPVLYLTYYTVRDRIAIKLLEYFIDSAYSHESMSGTAPLLLSFVCGIIAIWFSKKQHRYLGLGFILIQAAFYELTAFSYAGLRLQTMALFAQLLALSYCAKRPINRVQLAMALLICCLALSGTVRNFSASDGEPSAFTPYHFIWESR